MLQFSGKWGRFYAREAIAKALRKVKPDGRLAGGRPPFKPLINRTGQAFACAGEFMYLSLIMPDNRIASAFDRIEAALQRIERCILAPTPPAILDADADLSARHAALRETVDTSLGELDKLIERLER